MPTTRFQRIFLLAGITSLFAAYAGLWLRFINDPVERTGSDFIAFYSAGRVAQEHGLSKVYEPELQQNVQQEQVGFPLVQGQVLLYNHLPFLLPVLYGVVNGDYVGSFYRWAALLVVVYCASLVILGWALDASGVDRQTRILLSISSFLFLPLFFSLMNGQDTAILLLGTALWLYGLNTKKESLAGLGLSLTTVRPQLSLMLAIPMLFSHRKVFLTYVLGAGFLAALSVLIVGLDGARAYINILLISASGEWHGMKEQAMMNLIGILTRIWGTSNADGIRLFGWVIYGMTLVALIFLWTKQKLPIENRIGLTVIVSLFTSPHLHFHDLTLLLIPLYALLLSGHLKKFTATASPIAASLLLLVSNITPVLQYTTPYLLMLILALYPFYSKEKNRITSLHRS
jgi:hypothetical protein